MIMVMKIFNTLYDMLFVGIVALLFIIMPLYAHAELPTPEIENFSIKDREGTLICSLVLKNGMNDEIRKILNSGIMIKYTYTIELLRPGLLFNKKIKEVKKVRYLTYDHLKQEYRVLLGPNNQKMVSVKSEREAERFAFTLNDVEIINFASITQGRVYILRVKATIQQEKEAELPFSRLIGLFWKRTVETGWNEIRFRY